MKEISDIQRRIVTLFEARGAGQMRAALGEMRTGFGGWRRDLRDSRNELSMLDKQVRAFGTTARYALAGGALFGGVSLVSQISQIQQQLGMVSAISPTAFGGRSLVGEQLQQLGEQAEDAALRAMTPVTDFNAGLVNLVSTVQNVPENQVVPMLEEIAKTATLSMTPVDEATKGITGLMVAFGQAPTLANTRRFLAEYQRLIFTVPGGAAAGPQIIQQLPQLASVSRLSNLQPEQMFGLLNTVLRAGGSPATSARGLQYLIQGLAQPPSKEAKEALAAIGITPESTQREGGLASLFKLINAVRATGFKADIPALRGMGDDVLSQLEGTEGPDQLAGLGISGRGAELARTAVGRIHGVRSLILLAAQNDQALEDLRVMANLGNNQQQQISELRDAWKRYEDTAQLRKAALAINQMALDTAQIFEPVMNFVARRVTGLQGFVDAHTGETTAGLVGGAGALLLARRAMRTRGVFGTAVGAKAIYDTATSLGDPTAPLGSSPANPMYVVVVYSMSGFPRGNASPVPPVIPGGADPPTGRMGRWGRLGRGFKGLGYAGLAAAVGYETYQAFDPFGLNERNREAKSTKLYDFLTKPTGGFHVGLGLGGFTFGEHQRNLTPQQQKIIDRVEKGYLSEANAERMLRSVTGIQQLKEAGIKVSGKAEVTVKVDSGQGKQTKTKAIIDFAPDFTPAAPQLRGQNQIRRGGNG